MEKLKVGQVVVVTKAGNPGVGDDYGNGEVLLVTRLSNLGFSVATSATTGNENVRIFPREVELLEKKTVIFERRLGCNGRFAVGQEFELHHLKGALDGYGVMWGKLTPAYAGEYATVDGHAARVDAASRPREILFSEIEIGDKIRQEWTLRDGTEFSSEGVVHYIDGSHATGEVAGAILARREAFNAIDSAVLLLERPEKKNPFAEAKVGSMALGGAEMIFLKVGVDKWKALLRNGSWMSEGFRSDRALENVKDLRVTFEPYDGFELLPKS